MKTITLALFILLTTSPLQSRASGIDGAADSSQHDISGVVRSEGVDPVKSALLIIRLEDGQEWVSGGSRIETTYPPASTSKIPHTLIALETGYAAGPDTTFKWDGTQRFFDAWNQDQTLSSAYAYSAIWVYQQITRGLGYETMFDWINRLEYGNRNIGTEEDLTSYWLAGPLEISARGQIQFLSRLANNDLPLTPHTLRMGKQIMQADQGANWVLYAKTGWRSDGVNTDIGWYAGWLQKINGDQQQTYVFAFNMDMHEVSDRARRKSVVRSAFNWLGVIPD